MRLLDPTRSILVLVDLQARLLPVLDGVDALLEVTDRLLDLADWFDVPVVLTEQYPQGLGPTHEAVRTRFDALATPHRRVEKEAFGCGDAPSFNAALDALRPGQNTQVVLAGVEAHVCVLQTAFALRERGLDVHVCWDGVQGRGATYRHWAMHRMAQAGCQITNHESVGFEWARTKEHPRFKEMSRRFRAGQPSVAPAEPPSSG